MLLLIKLESNLILRKKLFLAVLKTNKISKNSENSYSDNNVAVGGGEGKNCPGKLHLTTYVNYCCCYGGLAHGSISLYTEGENVRRLRMGCRLVNTYTTPTPQMRH